jgi:hypothetical protein
MKYLVLTLLILFSTTGAFSQTPPLAEPFNRRLFSTLETPSYITWGEGFGNIEPLLYEACFAPEFRLSTAQLPNFGALVTPQIILRMYDQYSRPVRTPSYMPRATLYYRFDNNMQNKIDQFAYFTYGHHSNGQEGKFYESDSITFNKINGSFSSNYVTGGYELLSSTKKAFVPINSVRFSTTYYLIRQRELKDIYGKLRFFVDTETTLNLSTDRKNIFNNSKSKSRITGSMHLGWIALKMIDSKPFDIKRLIFSYTLSYQPAIINDIGLFARFYYGQDYYNINFDRTLTNVQFGLSIRSFSF